MCLRVLTLKTWRLRVAVMLIAAFVVGLAPAGASAAGVNLVIDGQRIEASPAPVIMDGRTLAPVRVISETLGAMVEWHEQSKTVTVTRGSRWLRLRIGNRLVDLAGGDASAILTDVPPGILDGRTFIPLRLVATALGVSVRWDAATRTVIVDSSVPVSGALPSPINLISVQPGQVITGTTALQVAITGEPPSGAAEVRFLLLNPQTGRGPVVARGSGLTGTYRLLPDALYAGARLLASVVYDEGGRFLTGDVIPVEVAIVPQVSLTGLLPGQQVEGTVPLAVQSNFLATHVEYEMVNPATGEVTKITKADPEGQFKWTPQPGDNGDRIVRAAAYDRTGQAHLSPAVPVTVAVKRRLALTGVPAGSTVDGPVTLGLSANFPVREVRYVLRDPGTGGEEVIARLSGSAKHRWLPAPGQAGGRDLLAVVTDDQGNTHRGDPVSLQVEGSPGIFLETVGPNQVLAGNVQFKSLSNVPLARIEYQLIDPKTGTERTIAGGTDPQASYTWTPGQSDAGSWQLRVVGVGQNGEKVESKAISVRVHSGPLYGPAPVIEKSQFLDFATGLAQRSRARTGMSAALQVAQAVLETGWGQSMPVDKYTGQPSYNLFGIKGQGPAGSIISNTWEEDNGITFRVDAAFRAYNNPAEGWDDHKHLLLTSSRYQPFREVMHDSTQGAWALKRAGYATDSQYPVKLIDIIKRYELYLLDEVDA